MWRKHVTLGLLTVIIGIWFASWQGYTPHISRLKTYQGQAGQDYEKLIKENLRLHLNNHHHLMIDEGRLNIAPLPESLFSAGKPYVTFFSAKKEDQVNHEVDLYTMQVNMGSNAYPISFTPPRNLTENPLSKDIIFDLRSANERDDRRGAHLLFGQVDQRGACRSISYLHWDERSFDEDDQRNILSQGLNSLINRHLFDRSLEPMWLVVRFQTPLPECRATWANNKESSTKEATNTLGRGADVFNIYSGAQLVTSVDVVTKTTSPIKSNIEIIKSPQDRQHVISTLQETLRIYDLLNLDEDLNLSVLRAKTATSFERNLYELISDKGDSRQHRPVGNVSSILDGRRPN